MISVCMCVCSLYLTLPPFHNTHTTLTQHSHNTYNTHTTLIQHSHNTHNSLTQHSTTLHVHTASLGAHLAHELLSALAEAVGGAFRKRYVIWTVRACMCICVHMSDIGLVCVLLLVRVPGAATLLPIMTRAAADPAIPLGVR